MFLLKLANKLLSFLIEMVMLWIYGYWGYTVGSSNAGKWTLAIVSVTLAIICWAVFAAPKSSTRLNYPGIIVFKVIMFLLAALLLYLMGWKIFAAVFVFIILINISLEIIFKQ